MRKTAMGLLVFSSILLTHCQPFKIAVSDELSRASELPVKGRTGILIKQKLSFGDYQTVKVKRSWTEGSEQNLRYLNTLGINYSQKRQSIHFTLADDNNNKSEVFCLSKMGAEDYTLGRNPNSIINIMSDILDVGVKSENTFAVSVFLNKEGNPWQMLIDNQGAQRHSKTYVGYLAKNKEEYYTIHPISALEKDGKKSNILAGSIGFEIRNKKGIALAAISTMDKGVVYLGETDKAERFLLANACAALLLQENLG